MADSGTWPYTSSSDFAWPPYPQTVGGAWPNWPPPNNNLYGWPGFSWSNGEKSGLGAGTIILVAVLVTGFSLIALLILRLWFCGCSQDDDARRRRVADSAGGGNERKMVFGLSKDVIESFEVVSYKALVGLNRRGGDESGNEGESESLSCPVCLIDFVEEDKRIRVLPGCGHGFHSECIDMWLFSHTSCPVCRRELQPLNPCNIIHNNFNNNNHFNNVSNSNTATPLPPPAPDRDHDHQVVIQIPQEELR